MPHPLTAVASTRLHPTRGQAGMESGVHDMMHMHGQGHEEENEEHEQGGEYEDGRGEEGEEEEEESHQDNHQEEDEDGDGHMDTTMDDEMSTHDASMATSSTPHPHPITCTTTSHHSALASTTTTRRVSPRKKEGKQPVRYTEMEHLDEGNMHQHDNDDNLNEDEDENDDGEFTLSREYSDHVDTASVSQDATLHSPSTTHPIQSQNTSTIPSTSKATATATRAIGTIIKPRKLNSKKKNGAGSSTSSSTRPPRKSTAGAPRIHPCDSCQKSFARKSDLFRHIRTHNNDKPFVCEICEKRFIQVSALTVHVRTHTGEKPYTCANCDKRFADSSSLVRHKRVHSGERPYICNINECDKAFCRNVTLLKHQLREHGLEKIRQDGKPYLSLMTDVPRKPRKKKVPGLILDNSALHGGGSAPSSSGTAAAGPSASAPSVKAENGGGYVQDGTDGTLPISTASSFGGSGIPTPTSAISQEPQHQASLQSYPSLLNQSLTSDAFDSNSALSRRASLASHSSSSAFATAQPLNLNLGTTYGIKQRLGSLHLQLPLPQYNAGVSGFAAHTAGMYEHGAGQSGNASANGGGPLTPGTPASIRSCFSAPDALSGNVNNGNNAGHTGMGVRPQDAGNSPFSEMDGTGNTGGNPPSSASNSFATPSVSRKPSTNGEYGGSNGGAGNEEMGYGFHVRGEGMGAHLQIHTQGLDAYSHARHQQSYPGPGPHSAGYTYPHHPYGNNASQMVATAPPTQTVFIEPHLPHHYGQSSTAGGHPYMMPPHSATYRLHPHAHLHYEHRYASLQPQFQHQQNQHHHVPTPTSVGASFFPPAAASSSTPTSLSRTAGSSDQDANANNAAMEKHSDPPSSASTAVFPYTHHVPASPHLPSSTSQEGAPNLGHGPATSGAYIYHPHYAPPPYGYAGPPYSAYGAPVATFPPGQYAEQPLTPDDHRAQRHYGTPTSDWTNTHIQMEEVGSYLHPHIQQRKHSLLSQGSINDEEGRTQIQHPGPVVAQQPLLPTHLTRSGSFHVKDVLGHTRKPSLPSGEGTSPFEPIFKMESEPVSPQLVIGDETM